MTAQNLANNVTDSLKAANEDLKNVARKVLKHSVVYCRSDGVSSYQT